MKITKSSKSTRLYAIKSTYDPATRKTSSKVVAKLGTAEEVMEREGLDYDGAIDWARERIAEMSAEEAEESEAVRVRLRPARLIRPDEPRCVNAGYLFPKKICAELGLRQLVNNLVQSEEHDFDLGETAEVLVAARTLLPTHRQVDLRALGPYPGALGISQSQLLQTAAALARHASELVPAVREASAKLHRIDASTLYYNSVGFSFLLEGASEIPGHHEPENPLIALDGKGQRLSEAENAGEASGGRRNPMTQGNSAGARALGGRQAHGGDVAEAESMFESSVKAGFVIDATGFPLSFDLGLSGKSKSVYLQPLENNISERFSRSRFVACVDEATAPESGHLLGAFNFMQRDFTVEHNVRRMRPNIRAWITDPSGWRVEGSNVELDLREVDNATCQDLVFYKERWQENEGSLSQRFFALFSPKMRHMQMNARLQAVQAPRLSGPSGLGIAAGPKNGAYDTGRANGPDSLGMLGARGLAGSGTLEAYGLGDSNAFGMSGLGSFVGLPEMNGLGAFGGAQEAVWPGGSRMLETGGQTHLQDEGKPAADGFGSSFINYYSIALDTGDYAMNVTPLLQQTGGRGVLLTADSMRYDGLSCFVTTLMSSPESLIQKVRHRQRCTERFRLSLGGLVGSPHFPDGTGLMREHFLISYLSYVVYSLMRERAGMDLSDEQLVSTLLNMNLVSIPGEGYLPAYNRTVLTDALHSSFGLRTDYEIITNRQLRSMLSRSS